ncbi:hypothetical protein FSOLCH5_010327 [Fusarium solani]
MFNLTGLAAEVAREKPNGEKNALRSSYTGHIKRLGIAGHFKVQKVENRGENDPQEESDFAQILHLGDEDWNNSFVRGREISLGLSQSSLSSLGRAVSMAKGSIKKDVWDTSVLGLQSSNGELKQPSSARPTAPNTPLNVPGAVGRLKAQGASANDPNRPRRNIKKRTYGDSSFEGYGEGYPDDDNAMEGGYSTGEGEGSQKRRKKVGQHFSHCAEFFVCVYLTLVSRTLATPHRTRALCGSKATAPAWLALEALAPLTRSPTHAPFLELAIHHTAAPSSPLIDLTERCLEAQRDCFLTHDTDAIRRLPPWLGLAWRRVTSHSA